MNSEYYMLKVEGKGNPSKIHLSLEEAQDEAERLCRKENCPVDVLVATYRCVPATRHTDKILNDLIDGPVTDAQVEETLDRLVELDGLLAQRDGQVVELEHHLSLGAPDIYEARKDYILTWDPGQAIVFGREAL